VAQLGIDITHLVDDDAHYFHQRRVDGGQAASVAHRATEILRRT